MMRPKVQHYHPRPQKPIHKCSTLDGFVLQRSECACTGWLRSTASARFGIVRGSSDAARNVRDCFRQTVVENCGSAGSCLNSYTNGNPARYSILIRQASVG